MSLSNSRRVMGLFVITMSFMLWGCASSPYAYFKPCPEERKFVPQKKIAVVSGRSDELSIALAGKIGKEIEKTNLFTVLSQEDIRKRIPKYPDEVDIIDFSLVKNNDLEDKKRTPWMSDGSKSTVDDIARKLKVDYVYIVWTENIISTIKEFETLFEMPYLSRMVEYPSGEVVAYSWVWAHKGVVSFEGEPEEQILKLEDFVAAEFAKEFEKSVAK